MFEIYGYIRLNNPIFFCNSLVTHNQKPLLIYLKFNHYSYLFVIVCLGFFSGKSRVLFQLKKQKMLNHIFVDFKEPDILNFRPTYKYDPGTTRWDSRLVTNFSFISDIILDQC